MKYAVYFTLERHKEPVVQTASMGQKHCGPPERSERKKRKKSPLLQTSRFLNCFGGNSKMIWLEK